jgi:hypothetical protein
MELMIAAGLLAAAIVVAALVMRSRPVAAPDPGGPARTRADAGHAGADARAPSAAHGPRNGSARLEDAGAQGGAAPGEPAAGPAGRLGTPDGAPHEPPLATLRRNGAAPTGTQPVPGASPAAAPVGIAPSASAPSSSAPSSSAPSPSASAAAPSAPAPSASSPSAPLRATLAATSTATDPAPAAPAPDPGLSPAMEASLARRLEEIDRRERRLGDREHELDGARAKLEAAHEQLVRELERVSGMSAGQAKQALLKDVEDDARHERALVLRQIEEETKRDAERRVRSILSVAMQRLAASHATETTVSVVSLPSDDMKGRIIGKEGRNIRALETLTGVDVIIDDTPNAVVLSAFDGVRREVARMTLEKLLQDGRIHPARIEETYYQAKSELEAHMRKVGEDAVLEADVHGLDPSSSASSAGCASAPPTARTSSPTPSSARTWPRPWRTSSAPRRRRPAARPSCTTSARPSRTRSRARTRSSAATSPAATASPRPSRTPWRPTTTRSSRRPWRR